MSTKRDDVNSPAHYTEGAVECIVAIESALGPEGFRAYLRGQIVKYVWRGPHKGAECQDYRKAEWYLRRLIGSAEAACDADGRPAHGEGP